MEIRIKNVRLYSFFAVDKNGNELVSNDTLSRGSDVWHNYNDNITYLPKGSIYKMTGKKLSWDDEPLVKYFYHEVVTF